MGDANKERLDLPLSLRAAYLALHRRANLGLRDLDITADQFVCLIILSEHEELVQKELVERANSDPNTIRAIVVLLEKKGLIIRQPHKTDKRARILRITPKGRSVTRKALQQSEPIRKQLTEKITDQQLATLNQLLRQIASSLA